MISAKAKIKEQIRAFISVKEAVLADEELPGQVHLLTLGVKSVAWTGRKLRQMCECISIPSSETAGE